MEELKYYTGIGSRKAPEPVTDIMSDLAVILYNLGYILRSGRAEASDYAFQRGAEFAMRQPMISSNTKTRQEIYIPNERFNACFGNIGAINPSKFKNYREAELLMEDIHPAGRRLKGFAREAHIRNMYQVLGQDLNTPSDLVILWAKPKGQFEVDGGTNSAFQLARLYKIPTFNLYKQEDKEALWKLLKIT
ncbi:hypothetical protein key_038 [Erwinia phage KEY]|uniref:Uncharacterized protein n=1 Tax=Erwinia phage KEY TaxID=2821255 RepID=A0AAE7WBK6_9CAUD|nr:hypothetical protein key_038 [Erwinia phage KEY]